jgi:hypothetical protein
VPLVVESEIPRTRCKRKSIALLFDLSSAAVLMLQQLAAMA